MDRLAYVRGAARLAVAAALLGGCDKDGGVAYVPPADLSSLVWVDPSADGPRNPDFGPVGCRSNADCQVIGGGSLCCSGACVNPSNDPKNCGACGAACPPVPNSMPVCTQGTCIVSDGCQGRDDCDHNPINGCETETSKDPANCGACGHVCAFPPGGLPTCTQGRCAAICAPGFADCDNDILNGCEMDTTLDVNNCGGCGKVCSAPANSKVACDLGKCGFRCALDFADCDANPANGCEVDVRADINNCGHCANICPPNKKCVGSRCQ